MRMESKGDKSWIKSSWIQHQPAPANAPKYRIPAQTIAEPLNCVTHTRPKQGFYDKPKMLWNQPAFTLSDWNPEQIRKECENEKEDVIREGWVWQRSCGHLPTVPILWMGPQSQSWHWNIYFSLGAGQSVCACMCSSPWLAVRGHILVRHHHCEVNSTVKTTCNFTEQFEDESLIEAWISLRLQLGWEQRWR